MLKADCLNVYRQAEVNSASGRDLEALVLTRAARALEECRQRWNAEDNGQRLQKALKVNQAIWTTFQNDLRKPDNPLPKKVREDILSLSLFIDRRTMEIMCKPAPEKLDVLIKINLNIASGLRACTAPAPEIRDRGDRDRGRTTANNRGSMEYRI